MFNKTIKFITLSTSVALLVVGCGKDYLEKEPDGGSITTEQLKEVAKFNPSLQESNVSGLYATMYKPGTGGTEDHDDFGQRGNDILSDMLSSDMAHIGVSYDWYVYLSQLKTTEDYTNLTNYKVWRYYYRIVRGANAVIETLEVDGNPPSDQNGKHLLGQAKAMRGYAYFYLLNFFVKEYNPTEEVLPIYTNTTTPNQPKSKAQDVADLIVADLTDAISLLETFQRSSKDQINKYVAEGLLAYTQAYLGNYNEVESLTKDIIQNGGFPLTTADDVAYYTGNSSLYTGFNNVETPGWMWGVDLTVESGIGLASWWGQCDLFTYSYQWAGNSKGIDQKLYDAISDKDVRKKQFYFKSSGSGYNYFPINKFFFSERKIGGQRTVTADYVYMRVAEMYLLRAEALSNLGKDNDAKIVLKQLLAKRFENTSDYAYVDALSDQSLKDEIYLQTRIELWGEGKSYLAMKRNKATVTRGSNHFFLSGKSFKYNDPKLTFVIPRSEVQNNPNISN